MRSIVRGVVALIAAFLMMDVAKAAPTIVSPADYATVKTMTDEMHSFLYSDAMLDPDTFTYTQTEYIAEDDEYRYVVTDERKAYMAEYNSNTIPVVFKWSAATGHSGNYTVTVKRVKDGKTVFTQTTSSTTVTFYDPEVGRNYLWTVTDNTGSATGHFYTDRRGPRIIYSETSDLTNARDLGGWSTSDGKVVKQGLIYRGPEWEWSARQKTDTGNYFEMPYLRDVLGIKLEVDLRAKDSKTGGTGVTGQTYIDYFKCGSVYESTIDSSIPRFFCEHGGATVAFPSYADFNSSDANRKAVWLTFTNFCDVVKADGTTKPVIFHCSHGKDRTGSLAYVLLGVLGVPRDSLERDWALSWYSEGKYDVFMNSKGPSATANTANSWILDNLITAIDNNYSGATLKDRCYNYLLACATSANVSAANAKALIDNYISIMLEEPETAAVNPDPNAPQPPEVEEPEVEVDEFVYTDYYFRGFGSFNSYYRWYKNLNQSSVCKDGFSPISYNNRIFIQPNATETQALGTYSRNCTGDMAFRTGMIVCDASKRSPNGLVGIYDCPFYFTSEGHTVSERCIFEHRAGRSEWTGVHFYFVDPYNTSKSVYDGLASFDVWGGSTLCISGFISKSPNKTYLKFPADNCKNAKVEVFYDDKEEYSTLGWFTGGSKDTTQYLYVTNAFMRFTTSGKVNGVAGALGLEFGLGVLNKTTTDPLLKITGTFTVNPGSTITVNAGGKSAGTYKLISAGTLNDGADLVANSSVVNCASGHYGVVRKSGNAINLVIIKGTPPSTGDTVIDPTVYGSADTASSTYTWRGYTGPWAYTTNWTASASANYGIPNNGTYATADFPATLANAFTCTLNKNYSVKYAKFDAPNMTLVIDNAALTVKDRANPSDYLAYGFGTGENASATLEFRGASAGIVSSKSEGRCMFGLEKDATDKLRCTVRFIVPASGWESTAPIRATGGDCSVYFWYDAKLVIDATALGVPAEGAKKTVLLATASDYLANYAKVELTCAAGAKGTVAVVDDNKLVLTVEAGEIVEEPVLTAVDAPVAQTGLVYTGSELTGVVASTGYMLTGNMATDAGEYTALATLAEGYKWSDDTTADKSITWVIAKATNEWTIEPSISLTEWNQGETAGVLTAGVAKFGTVTASMTELPTEVGTYAITYTVADTKNYTGLTATVQFEIKAVVVEPDPVPDPEPDPEPDPVEPKLEIDPAVGYIVTELGELKDQVAVVFTNANNYAWTMPKGAKNVEFLVVGGGGGGGGHYKGTETKLNQGGSGGGGGAVVTGFVNNIAYGASMTINVGEGGEGGIATSGTTTDGLVGANGGNSYFKVGDITYITAYGGGGDGGKSSTGVAIGGSNSGSRGRYEGSTASITATALANVEYVGAGADVSNVHCMRNKGTDGYQTDSGAPGGGGGGAMSEGFRATGSGSGSAGGAGYKSDITGESKVYGSGGASGLGKSVAGGAEIGKGGVGAGSGYANENGGDALANQGGGGGGGSYEKAGGAGGSGIIVLRFAYFEGNIVVDAEVDVKSKISSKAYTGSPLTSGLVNTYAYSVEELTDDLVNVGKKTVRVTLNDGYIWSDGDTNKSKDFDWYIAAVESMDNGYKVVGLGEKGDEVAVVFTNHATTINWTVPQNLKNAQFLVVGGGAGGGADSHYDAASGGAGGGGGSVVVGEVDITKDAIVTVKLGAGGAGGQARTNQTDGESGTFYGASKKGGNTTFAVAGTTYVTAYGGGRDQGTTAKDTAAITTSQVNVGGVGGSNGGSRGGYTTAQATTPKMGVFADVADLHNCVTYGNIGGKGCSEYYYGYPSAGGGGGAIEVGGDAGNKLDNWSGGKGGEGLVSDITGTRVVYGSGGGGASTQGASGGNGGEGAGNGGDNDNPQGTSGLANQGGGGGGSSREATYGGNGGSGIVVIRYTLEPEWTPPMPEKDGEADFKVEYNPEVLAALEAKAATSVDVKVNGVKLKGDKAVEALNTAVKNFDDALTFNETAASLDIVIEVTEVNVENPAASKYIVKRGDAVLNIKEGANVTTKINRINNLNSDAVIFRLVIE